MGQIVQDNGVITYDNTVIQMQVKQQDGYSPLYPIENAEGVQFNKNTLTLPDKTGNNTYETPYRALGWTYNNKQYFALNQTIYWYDGSTLMDNGTYPSVMQDNYYVDISAPYDNVVWLLTNKGKLFDFIKRQWYELDIDADFTGISVWNNTAIITTNNGVYQVDLITMNSTLIDSNMYYCSDIITYGSTKGILLLGNGVGKFSPLVYPFIFTGISQDVLNRFYGYKNIIPQFNAVIFQNGVWFTTATTTAQLNTSDLVNLKDTQYINYLSRWNSGKYECSNNKWNMSVKYNSYGIIDSTTDIPYGAPMYMTCQNSDGYILICNNGKGCRVTYSGGELVFIDPFTIDEQTLRAPRYSYHNDISYTQTGGNITFNADITTQQAIENIDSQLSGNGRTFEKVEPIPFTVAQLNNNSDIMSQIIYNQDGTYGALHDGQNGDLYIIDKDKNVFYRSTLQPTRGYIGSETVTFDTDICWKGNKLYGLTGWSNGSSRPTAYIFEIDATTMMSVFYNTGISVLPLSAKDQFCGFTITDDYVMMSLGDESVTKGYVYYGVVPSDGNLNNITWNQVDISALSDYTEIVNIQNITFNNTNTIYCLANAGGYNTPCGMFYLNTVNGNLVTMIHGLEGLGDIPYRHTPILYTDGTELKFVCYDTVSGGVELNHFSNFGSLVQTETIYKFTNVTTPKLYYDSTNSKWCIYNGDINNHDSVLEYYIVGSTPTQTTQLSLQSLVNRNNIDGTRLFPFINFVNGRLEIVAQTGTWGYCTNENSVLTFTPQSQLLYNSDCTIYQATKCGDKYAMLYKTNTIFNNYTYVGYSEDGINWVGGYRISGYYDDMVYHNGGLWLSGWSYDDTNARMVLTLIYSTYNYTVGQYASPDIGAYEILTKDFSSSDIMNLSSNIDIGAIHTSISGTGETIGVIHYNGSNTTLSGVKINVNTNVYYIAYSRDYTGRCDKISALGYNTYCYGVYHDSDATFYRFSVQSSGAEYATIHDTLKMAAICGVSDYDPVHDGVYFVVSSDGSGDTYAPVMLYTQGRVFNIGALDKQSGSPYDNQIGYFNGRYLYNTTNDGNPQGTYGIVPFFNSSPEECKPINTIGAIEKLSIAGSLVFVVSDGELYVSKGRR